MKYKKIQTEQQWLNEGIAKYGAWIPNWRFKCPGCGRINTAEEVDKVGLDVEDASQFCIGNFKKKTGCNYATMRTISRHNEGCRLIRFDDGRRLAVFDFSD